MNTSLQQSPSATLAETLDVVDAVIAQLSHRLPPHVSREDLASAGKVALVEALLRFSGPPEEARAYCYVRVRGAVLDELRRLDPLSRYTRTQIKIVRRAAAMLECKLGRVPAAAEVAATTGFSLESLAHLDQLALAAEACSAEETGEDGELMHSLVDAGACPARTAESDDTTASVQAALGRLAPTHAHVLRRYYLDDATLEDIAAELGVSKERVRQIREAAEKKLRADFIVLALWQSFLNRRY